MKNVLVFPCGSEIGLEIHRALVDSKHFTLFGASSVDDHGKYLYFNYAGGLPFIDAPNFIVELNKVIELYNIDFVIPAHDSAVLRLAENSEHIKAKVVTSCVETCRVCRSKLRTYELFAPLLATPEVYTATGPMSFPVFLKPDVGQGSKGTHTAKTKEGVEFYTNADKSLLVLEYLPGREYTVDCFTDRKGNLLFAEGRERSRIYNGISVNSERVVDARFQKLAEIINRTLCFQGVWFFQVKERMDGELVLMEISPRIAGTMALFRVCGVNFIELSLFDLMQVDVSILYNKLSINIDRALFARYSINADYDTVYIDFDDTIIVRDSVNTNVIKFIYQSKNSGKKIVLITRHRLDIRESLRKYALSEGLFSEIIVVGDNEEKSDYIKETNSIFIDDSFAERKKVFEKVQIPVFAVDAVEALLTWAG